ncbi:Z1 domain-containing protein [Vibrio alginolyticus]|uniref:Z1 domain-containing protein n=1 Tax=Vibrio alginolyticus TaxID=663 RepID=UPI00375400DB
MIIEQEKQIELAIKLTRMEITSCFIEQGKLPTPVELEGILTSYFQRFGITLSERDFGQVVDNLRIHFSVEVEGQSATVADNSDHIEWLPKRKGQIEWGFWKRYETYLLDEKGLPVESVKSIHRTTDKALAHLEDPNRSGDWDRRGLVVGSVQSGKTGNYTGLICKAADAGYKVIVVLAGIHNDLRAQTQMRLDEGFLGYSSENGAGSKVGVGKDYTNKLKANTITTCAENGDFQYNTAKQFNIAPDQTPLLFVIKKNVSILENLNAWVSQFADMKSNKVKDTSILVIDDEADQASIDTSDYDPTAINRLIRKLLNSFEKSAYVGYTATPFANVLISDVGKHNQYGEDLFPKSFILTLPTPSNYIGPNKIFSTEADQNYPIIRSLTDDIDDASEWIPTPHKKDLIPFYRDEGKIPPCLENAVISFIISVAIRNLRGARNKHNTMLIHVTRFKDVQLEVAEQVQDFLDKVTNQFFDNDNFIERVRQVWHQDYMETTKTIRGSVDQSWDAVQHEICEILESFEVKTINGSSKEGLEYNREDYPERVIAVGGDKLSRGLTLEGLSVSYFLRQSNMYDTLMQMGRWFGYRPNYDDLCRLYTNSSMVSSFQSILSASEELVEELNEMSELGMSPKDFGLKVKVHPGLLVTNRLKMRETREVDVSFASGVAESTALSTSELRNNWERLNQFLSLYQPHQISTNKQISTNYISRNWKDIIYIDSVKGIDIANLVADLKTLESSTSVVPAVIAKYINTQVSSGELTDWTVVIHSGSGQNVNFDNGLTVNASKRKVLKNDSDRLTFRRLASKHDEFVDLNSDEVTKKLDIWRARESTNLKIKDIHSRQIRHKSKGLLMFYIVEPTDKDKQLIHTDSPVVGFMVSFPRSQTAKTVKYVANNVWINENL